MRFQCRVWALVALASACGGRHVYTPRVVRVERERIETLQVREQIALVNAQPSTTEEMLLTSGASLVVANYHAWTDVAVEELREALVARGMPEDGTPVRRVEVAVTAVEAHVGFLARCTPTMTVTTGDGFSAPITGTAGSSRNLFAACEVAMARTVANVLEHRRVAAYVAGSPPP